jgi:hypothetical protein
MAAMTPEMLRERGLDALRRELGTAGMLRFLQQFSMGSGDYTAERWQLLRVEDDVPGLTKAIQEMAETPKGPAA